MRPITSTGGSPDRLPGTEGYAPKDALSARELLLEHQQRSSREVRITRHHARPPCPIPIRETVRVRTLPMAGVPERGRMVARKAFR